MVAPFSKFYGKILVGFHTNRKSIGSSKERYSDFQNSPPFERSTCFYVTISENFEHFQYFNFETDFPTVPTTQTPIFLLFLSAGVLFDGAFSL